MRYKYYQRLIEKNPGKYPRRIGEPWLYEEEFKLLKSVREKKTIEEIAKEHERTNTAIKCKLKAFAWDYWNENKTKEQIMLYTGLTESEINDIIEGQGVLLSKKDKNIRKDKTIQNSIEKYFDFEEKNDSYGYIYCFGNESMPGIVKIGMTDRNPEDRLRDANRHDTFKPPLPYTIKVAKYVKNPLEKEKILHKLFSRYSERVNNNREFFRISLDEVILFFDLIDGTYWDIQVN